MKKFLLAAAEWLLFRIADKVVSALDWIERHSPPSEESDDLMEYLHAIDDARDALINVQRLQNAVHIPRHRRTH